MTIISWIPGHAASYLGADADRPGGEARLDYFKKVGHGGCCGCGLLCGLFWTRAVMRAVMVRLFTTGVLGVHSSPRSAASVDAFAELAGA